MNDLLANMYGTREVIGAVDAPQDQASDVEKLAEARLLEDTLASEGLTLNDVDGETLLKVAYDLFGENSELIKEAAEAAEGEGEGEGEGEPPKKGEGEEPEKESSFEEKVAEADLCGRVMAHAYTQERAEIEKEAQVGTAAKALGREIAKAGKKGAKAVGEWAKAPPKTLKALRTPTKFHPGTKGVQTWGRGEALKETIRRHPGQAAAAGAGAAGVGSLAALKAKGKKKKASAIDVLAEQRALELLKEAGINPETGEAPTEEEKLAHAVEQRAWEMLAENGFTE